MQIAKSSVHLPRSRQRPLGGPHRHKHACNASSQAPTSVGVARTAWAVRGQTAPTGASAVAAVKTRWHSRPLDPIQRGGSRFALGPTPIPSSPQKPPTSAAEERAWWGCPAAGKRPARVSLACCGRSADVDGPSHFRRSGFGHVGQHRPGLRGFFSKFRPFFSIFGTKRLAPKRLV